MQLYPLWSSLLLAVYVKDELNSLWALGDCWSVVAEHSSCVLGYVDEVVARSCRSSGKKTLDYKPSLCLKLAEVVE